MVPDFNRDVHCIFGLPFDAVDLTQAEHRVRSAIAERCPCFVSTPNLNFLISSQTNSAFRDSVFRSDLSIADGMPIVWMAKLLGIPIRSRVAGSALFEQLASTKGEPIKIYFFGGQEGVAEEACRRLNATATGMRCVGFKCPGFGTVAEMSDEAIIADINASKADFVVVSLGAAKGQAWIEANRHRLSAPVISHLGAVVNFVAGTVSRAPTLLQNLGAEWLWRIREEPALWRRYVHDGRALLRLAALNLLPLMLDRAKRALFSAPITATTFRIDDTGDRSVFVLSGDWRASNLGPLRDAFSEFSSKKKNIVIDVANVINIDSAFIGLAMLLYGFQLHNGRKMVLVSANKKISNYLRYACADFMLNETGLASNLGHWNDSSQDSRRGCS